MTATFYVGDAIQVMNTLPEKSVDLILTSPPFLALRSYLPQDHPDKALEGGSQATPGAYVDWLIDVVEACARVLTRHGSLVFELGDTFAGSGGAGGDYGEDGIRDGQNAYDGSARRTRINQYGDGITARWAEGATGYHSVPTKGTGWPLAKSLSLIPESFRFAMVYGHNPHTGRKTEPWRLRNVIRWVRPNPPVGALGDKFRPATSELMVFCKSKDRYFDLDAVRESYKQPERIGKTQDNGTKGSDQEHVVAGGWTNQPNFTREDRGGAPPLDWWNIPPGGYSGFTTWKTKVPVDPSTFDGFAGDIQHTVSADCPVHGDQSDPVPTESHDEREANAPIRNRGTGNHPAQGQLTDFAPTDPLLWPNLEDGSSDSPDPESIPAATPHSKPSRKKAPAPATNSPGIASDRTVDRIDDMSESPLSDEPRPDTQGSRTSEVCPFGCSPETCDHNADIPSAPFDGACTCSYYVEKANNTSHYAVWPPELLVKPIKAMVPEMVCRTCGQPRRRIVETTYEPMTAGGRVRTSDSATKQDPESRRLEPRATAATTSGHNPSAQTMAFGRASKVSNTLGFSDCGHDDYRPGLVLDPFAGSGTTLAVATGHGRDAIGIDLDERNYELALDRVGPLILERGTEPARRINS